MAGRIRKNADGEILKNADGEIVFDGPDCRPADLCPEELSTAQPACIKLGELPSTGTVFLFNGVCYEFNLPPKESVCDQWHIESMSGLPTYANCGLCGTICDNCDHNLPPMLQFVVSGVDPLFSCTPCDDTFSALTSDDESDTSVDGTYTFSISGCGESWSMGLPTTVRKFCCEVSAPECTCISSDANYEENDVDPSLILTTRQTSGPNSGQVRCQIAIGSPVESFLAFDDWVTVGVDSCWNAVWTNSLTKSCLNNFSGCGIDEAFASDSGTVTMSPVWL